MRRIWMAAVAVVFLSGAVGWALPREATISVGREPEPPFCVDNPGGTVEITWEIEHMTTPDHVYYKLEDPTRTITYDEEVCPDSSGLSVTRYWTVPPDVDDGLYWVRVEYWSVEAGNEANAEVTFYVCTQTSTLCAYKWGDTDCDSTLTGADDPLEGWWICIVTPDDETYCLQTGPDGNVCWEGIPLGHYTVYEILEPDWYPIYPESIELDLGPDPAEVIFFNSICASPAERSSWSSIKRLFKK